MFRTLFVFFLVGCGSGPTKANPCATPGATYLEHYVEHSGGTCGALTDTIVNIGADGTLASSSPVTCDDVEQTGCTAHDTNCKGAAVNGITCSDTFSNTFSSDGSGASGIATITCTGSTSCVSTYDITMTRQ